MNRRAFLGQTAAGTTLLAASVPGIREGRTPEGKVHSAYGAWLAYLMNEKRIDSEKLAKKAGVDRRLIDRLINGEVAPEEAREQVAKLGEIILEAKPAKLQMARVLKALEIHTDLRNWMGSCDGGCCGWNVATEIAYDAALIIR